jgi:hypothetical protein
MGYAEYTTVPAENTRAEIERIICRYAGREAEFSFGRMAGQAAIMFVACGRRVKFVVLLPTNEEAEVKSRRKNAAAGSAVTESQREAWIEQETRRRWRCLLLAIKAKLEVVETGIATFEEEFLAHIMVDDGNTIYEKIQMEAISGKKLLSGVEKLRHPV